MIYVIQGLEGTPVKIGYTGHPKVGPRVLSIQTNHPYPLSILYTFAGDKADERAIHAALADYRLLGEWFEWCRPVSGLLHNCSSMGIARALEFYARLARIPDDEQGMFYVPESNAHLLLRIPSKLLRDRRLSGDGPPYIVKTGTRGENRYYNLSALRVWLTAQGISYVLDWSESRFIKAINDL